MFRFTVAGTAVECDTADELKDLLSSATATKPTKRKNSAAGATAKKAWAAARKLAKSKGISVMEARKQLAKSAK